MLEEITNWLIELIDQIGYIGIFIATSIESFFAPLPSEIVLITAGLYAKETGGIFDLILISVLAAAGNYFGTLFFYILSRWGRERFVDNFIERWGPFLLISQKDMERADQLFEKRGGLMVFIARLIPGIRTLIAFPAGLAQMPILKYTIFTLAGSFFWNMFLTSIGFFAYEYKEDIFSVLEPFENLILFILAAIIGAYLLKVIWEIRKMRLKNKTSNVDSPK
jgi:membrane protein DedA with SNARE-associated domain